MSDETKHGPTDYGKGSIPRPVDRTSWEKYWIEYCNKHGCAYNCFDICIYCGHERKDNDE